MKQIVTRLQGFREFAFAAAVLLSMLNIAGCAAPPAVTQSTKVTCMVPVITPQVETKESQEKGGIEISIAPVNYTMGVQQHVTINQIPPPQFTVTRQGDVYVKRTTYSTAEVTPSNLRFVLKVNNKMPRVFHGSGTVVQFNVGGRLQAVDQGGYNNFLGAIIPPRQEQQIEIIGPPLASLTSDKGILGVFLYDVVTKQNEAGVVTEKQNFEWYFDYTLEARQKTVETRIEEQWMSVYEYSQETARQSMDAARQMQPGAQFAPPQR